MANSGEYLKCSACGLTYMKYAGHTCDPRIITGPHPPAQQAAEVSMLRTIVAVLCLLLALSGVGNLILLLAPR